MNSPRPDASNPKDQDTASAEWLLQNDDSPRAAAPKPVLPPGAGEEFEFADEPKDLSGPLDSTGDFELVDPPSDPPAVPVKPPSAKAAAAPIRENPAAPSAGPRPHPRPRPSQSAPARPAVEEVWTRTAEWRQTLVVLAAWAFAMFGLLFFAATAELFGMSVLVLLFGFFGGIILSYPIFITLERPVRITPEQAARDYFGALSHYLPHYRRMWLLLSTRGRTSAHFASFEEFRTYWTGMLDRLRRRSRAGRLTPLVFQVIDFEGDKSADKSEMNARFKIKVLVSDGRDERHVLSVALQRSFVRGPDAMWYLDDGTFPEYDTPQTPRKPNHSKS
jgi:hypothetical protein